MIETMPATPSRWRVGLTVFLVVSSLASAGLSFAVLRVANRSGALHAAIDGAGYLPAVTARIAEWAPVFPWIVLGSVLVAAAAASAVARSRWTAEARLWTITFLAALLAMTSLMLPALVLFDVFVLPRLAMAAGAGG